MSGKQKCSARLDAAPASCESRIAVVRRALNVVKKYPWGVCSRSSSPRAVLWTSVETPLSLLHSGLCRISSYHRRRTAAPVSLIASDYKAPPLLGWSGHLNTLFAHFFRRVEDLRYRRERIDTPDGDFLDLDWSEVGAGRVAILSHGLEGSTRRGYIRGMVHALNRRGWDALAWNLRGCGSESNRLLRTYHSGATEDLEAVVQHVLREGSYKALALVGFSLGGNLTLKYLGERGRAVDERLRCAAAFSVPCDLASSADRLAELTNWHYTQHFLRMLHRSIQQKAEVWPDEISDKHFGRIRTLTDFDDCYTAPLNDFDSAEDYYRQASSRPFLARIRVPTLLVNATDDPFLAPPCYPVEEARDHPHFHLEIPESGGHVGFVQLGSDGEYWSETRAAAFLEAHASGAAHCEEKRKALESVGGTTSRARA